MIKIDFFGGLHGNFLELVLNLGFFPEKFRVSDNMFDATGGCHVKDMLQDYQPIVRCNHWSWNAIPFENNDKVIRIRPDARLLSVAITNTYLRSGGQSLDIDNLEQNTIAKLEAVKDKKKTTPFLETLIAEHGVRDNYPRSVLRNYFYAMFTTPEFGIHLYSYFDPNTPDYFEFAFADFFNVTDFFIAAAEIGRYLNLSFQPSPIIQSLYNDFIAKNQGWHSKLKCDTVIANILSGTSSKLCLNLIEEAWINRFISEAFGCVALPVVWQEQYPCDTALISQALLDQRHI